MFGDLDGFDHLKHNLKAHPQSMAAFCEAVPALVSKHVINQCYIRDDDETETVQFRKTGMDSFDAMKEANENAPEHVPLIQMLYHYVLEKIKSYDGKPATSTIPFDALRACTVQNDANKRAITKMGGVTWLLKASSACIPTQEGCKPASADILTSVLMAFSSLCKDDDPRQPSCVPAGVENRDNVGKTDFPELRRICRISIELYGDDEKVGQNICDVVFPLLKVTLVYFSFFNFCASYQRSKT